MIQDFCRKADENCVLPGYYAASSGNSLLTCPIFKSQEFKKKAENPSTGFT